VFRGAPAKLALTEFERARAGARSDEKSRIHRARLELDQLIFGPPGIGRKKGRPPRVLARETKRSSLPEEHQKRRSERYYNLASAFPDMLSRSFPDGEARIAGAGDLNFRAQISARKFKILSCPLAKSLLPLISNYWINMNNPMGIIGSSSRARLRSSMRFAHAPFHAVISLIMRVIPSACSVAETARKLRNPPSPRPGWFK
jgi:hypothetical protein